MRQKLNDFIRRFRRAEIDFRRGKEKRRVRSEKQT